MVAKEEKLVVESSIVEKEQEAIKKAENAIKKADPKSSPNPETPEPTASEKVKQVAKTAEAIQKAKDHSRKVQKGDASAATTTPAAANTMASSDCLLLKYKHGGAKGEELALKVSHTDKYAPKKTGVYSAGLAALDVDDIA